MKGLEIIKHESEGYKTAHSFESWRVAYLSHAERFQKENLCQLERHLLTDEIFMLLSGEGTLIIGEEPEELLTHLKHCSLFHKYFPSGTGDIFPIDVTVHRNPEYVLDVVKGSFAKDLRYLSFYSSDSDVVRVTGYLAKRSEIEKLKAGNAVLQDTTMLAKDAFVNAHIPDRKVR